MQEQQFGGRIFGTYAVHKCSTLYHSTAKSACSGHRVHMGMGVVAMHYKQTLFAGRFGREIQLYGILFQKFFAGKMRLALYNIAPVCKVIDAFACSGKGTHILQNHITCFFIGNNHFTRSAGKLVTIPSVN